MLWATFLFAQSSFHAKQITKDESKALCVPTRWESGLPSGGTWVWSRPGTLHASLSFVPHMPPLPHAAPNHVDQEMLGVTQM